MAQVINGWRCDELRDGFAESVSVESGPSATKKLLVDWAGRYAVAQGLLSLISYSFSGGQLRISAPGAYPESGNIFCREVTIRGVGPATQGPKQIQFPYAVVSITYGMPSYNVTPDPEQSLDPQAPMVYCTEEIDFGGSFITVPRSALKLADGTALDQDVGRFVGVNSIHTTFPMFPYMPTGAMRSLIGKMNDSPFLGSPTGTLMLTGMKNRRTASTDGSATQEVAYQFNERPEAAWDKVFSKSGWVQVQQAGTSQSFLKSGDFTALIPGFYRGR